MLIFSTSIYNIHWYTYVTRVYIINSKYGHRHRHAARTWPCSIKTDMWQRHGYEASTWTEQHRHGQMNIKLGHAEWTCSNDMQRGHATWTCSLDIQRRHRAEIQHRQKQHRLAEWDAAWTISHAAWTCLLWGWQALQNTVSHFYCFAGLVSLVPLAMIFSRKAILVILIIFAKQFLSRTYSQPYKLGIIAARYLCSKVER